MDACYAAKTVDQMISEISSSKVKVGIRYVSPNVKDLSAALPYGCRLSGRLRGRDESATALYPGEGVFFVDYMAVPEELQRNGIGARMMRASARAAVENGARYFLGRISSLGGDRTREAVFGRDNVDRKQINGVMITSSDMDRVDTSKFEAPEYV